MGSDVHSLIGAFHDALLDPGQWSSTLRDFADRFGSNHAIMAINGRSSRPPDVVWAGVEQAFQDLYANSFVSGSNPVLLAPSRELQHQPFTDRMAMPDGSFRRSAFFQDWCRPQRIETLLGAEVIRDGRGVALLGLGRSEPYGDSELSLFRGLMPDLRRVMALRLRLLELDLQQARLRALLDAVCTPILLTDNACHLLHANRRAEDLLRAGDVLRAPHGRLAAANEPATDALRVSVRQVNSSGHGVRLNLPAARGNHADIVIVPVAPDHGWAEGSETCVAVFVTAGEGGVDLDPALLTALYRLTPTEAAVAATLSHGDGLPSAAKALGMQVSTARTHLHRIFDKTGTQRQSQLVWLLKSLPQ